MLIPVVFGGDHELLPPHVECVRTWRGGLVRRRQESAWWASGSRRRSTVAAAASLGVTSAPPSTSGSNSRIRRVPRARVALGQQQNVFDGERRPAHQRVEPRQGLPARQVPTQVERGAGWRGDGKPADVRLFIFGKCSLTDTEPALWSDSRDQFDTHSAPCKADAATPAMTACLPRRQPGTHDAVSKVGIGCFGT